MANRTGGARLAKQWESFNAIQRALTADATLQGTSLASTTAQTILRMLGSYIICPTSAPVAGDAALVVVGIGVVSTDAFAAGAGSMPDPGAEPDYPWLYWKSHGFFFPTNTADPSAASGSIRVDFDIRSMRKMKPRESLAWVIEYIDLAGTPPLQLDIAHTRVLIGLH